MLLFLRQILSILILPVTMTVIVPSAILARPSAQLLGWPPAQPLSFAAGIAVILVGLAFAVTTIWHFGTVGRGTLAPWDPPRHFVVTGLYRRVRNPMISGVVLILLGEALLFRSRGLLSWAATFFLIKALYIPLMEEPFLERRFGDEYRLYLRNVPRWLPRLTAWTPPWAAAEAVGSGAR